MRTRFARFVPWLLGAVVVTMALLSGGADGWIGSFLVVWMFYRAAPAMWRDLRGWSGWLRRRRVSFGGRGKHASELNV